MIQKKIRNKWQILKKFEVNGGFEVVTINSTVDLHDHLFFIAFCSRSRVRMVNMVLQFLFVTSS